MAGSRGAVSRAEFDALLEKVEELQEARRAFDDALYGKEPNDKNCFKYRVDSLESDRNLLRWLIGLLGGIGVAVFKKYIPWLNGGAGG